MTDWISSHIPPWVWILLVAHLAILGTVAYLILLERKVASWVQDRIGPNRVGLGFGVIPGLKNFHFWGLGQPLADGLKFVLKEDYRPAGVDRVLFTLAPGAMMLVVIISIAVLPWGGVRQAQRTIALPASVADARDYAQHQLTSGSVLVSDPQRISATQCVVTYRYPFQIATLNIGVLYILAVLSLGVYGVVVGGWASNNKYSFLGGLRATVNMISYEIPLGLAVLCIILTYGTLDLASIVQKQCHYWAGVVPAWNVFTQPLAFLMFLICIHAEANRAPFDLAEAEQELIGGYHTEYSAMRFALFFLAEYAGMITTSAVCVAIFFGGWQVPGLDRFVCWFLNSFFHAGVWVDAANPALTNSLVVCIVRSMVFFIKTLLIIFVFMWVRWTLPRFRFDQLMMLAWRGLIPIALALLVMTAVVVYAFGGQSFQSLNGRMAVAFLAGNLAALALILAVSRLIPPAPPTNRRVKIIGSRFDKTPLPAVLISSKRAQA